MDDLIARLEKATGPDRELDLAILKYVEGQKPDRLASPRYTESLDVAMTLLPEGAEFQVGSANLLRKYWAAVITATQEARAINCATPAIALSSAALRARKALTGGE